MIYRGILDARRITTLWYLIIPNHAYVYVFDTIALNVLKRNQIGLLVIDLDEARIITWKQ